MVEYLMFAVCFAYFFGYDGKIARTGSRRKAQTQMRIVDFIDLYALDFCQLLHAALHLYGFGGFVAEALNELLGVCNLFLLVAIGAHLLFDALASQFDEFGIVHRIVIDFSERDFNCTVCHIVDERAVVADKHYGLGFCRKKVFEPLYRFYVEVVGRFVEQQHVGTTQQKFRQFYAHTPSAGKFGCRTVEIAAFEAQTDKGFLHLGLAVLGSGYAYLLCESSHAVDQEVILFAFIIGALGKF